MAKEYFTFEATGGLTAVDAFKNGVATGSTTVKPLVVPAGKPHLSAIIPVATSDGAATGASTFVVRIGGSGVVRTADIAMSGFGATLNTTHSTPLPLELLDDLGIQCIPGNEITVQFGMFGADSGTAEAACTLVFSDRAPTNGWFEYQSREVLATAVDTLIGLQGLGSAVTANIKVPGDIANEMALDRLIVVTAADAAGTGAGFETLRLAGNGVRLQPELCIGASGGTQATEANGHTSAKILDKLEIEVTASNEIEASALMAGTDIGSVAICVTFGFMVTGK